MTIALPRIPAGPVTRLTDRVTIAASRVLFADPVGYLAEKRRAENAIAPIVIIVIAIVALVAIAAAVSVAVAIVCSRRGMTYVSHVKVGFFEMKIACRG